MNQFFYTCDKDDIMIKHYIYKNSAYHFNWHKELEILTVLNGEIEVCIEGTSRVLKTDDMIFVNSNEGHASLAKKPNSIAMVIRIDPSVFKSYYKNYENFHFEYLFEEGVSNENLFRLLRAHQSEMIISKLGKTPESEILFKSAYYSLLHTIVSNYPPEEIKHRNLTRSNNRTEAIKNIVRYIDDNHGQKISLEDLAEISQYNKNYISQLFRTHVGINFYDYLTRVRLREATLEIGQSEDTISEIALSNGFSDIKAFNKVFKASFGKTPTEYRSQLNNEITKNDADFQKEFILCSDEAVKRKLRSYLKK